ncbi:hypothetical protein JL720_16367 [Aureococcus anophagefferens]|nr:hypothetical protein JL720_16367 [Aureococcus anophagefferens]
MVSVLRASRPAPRRPGDVLVGYAHRDGRITGTDGHLRSGTDHNGYNRVRLANKRFGRSQLIAFAFVLGACNLAKFQLTAIDHLDGCTSHDSFDNIEVLYGFDADKENTRRAREAAKRAGEESAAQKSAVKKGAACEWRRVKKDGTAIRGEGWTHADGRRQAACATGVAGHSMVENAIASGDVVKGGRHYFVFRDASAMTKIKGERWKRAPAPWASVEVSSHGRVRDYETKRERLPTKTGRYLSLKIAYKQVGLHVLVKTTFDGRPPLHKPVVMHVNGDCHDCRLVNLRFGTAAENEAMKKDHGTATGGGAKHAVAYRAVGAANWIVVGSQKAAATATGVAKSTLSEAVKSSTPKRGKGKVMFEFKDLSIPDDFDDFVPIVLSKEVYDHSIPALTIVRALLGRTICDVKTQEYFQIVSVFNDDELGRLCVEYFDKSLLDDPDLDVDDIIAADDLAFSYVYLMGDEHLVDEVEQTKKRKREKIDDLPINERYALNFN